MTSVVVDPDLGAAIDMIATGIDALLAAGVAPVDGLDAIAVISQLETQCRRLSRLQVQVLDEIDRAGLHRADGHHSAKTMFRHVARLSAPEAARRAQIAKALRDLPKVAAAFADGQIGECQVQRISRAHANGRVRQPLIAAEDTFIAWATRHSYRDFDAHVTDWVRVVDEDGTCDTAERNHERRDCRIGQDFDGGWNLTAGCGSLQGATMHEIFERFLAAEVLADWEKARAEYGDQATTDDLARTAAQRRFDALFNVFTQAGHRGPGGAGPAVVTNIVIDADTFERVIYQLAGGDPGPADPTRTGFRCSTLAGHPLDPTETVANALLGHVRRVVVGSDRVVVDLGRKQRLFTGSAQLAVRLSSTECYWPGCHVPVNACQVDHLTPWTDSPSRGPTGHGGSTSPGNGALACGKHNRYKEHGFHVTRDATGTIHVYRPDGSEIE